MFGKRILVNLYIVLGILIIGFAIAYSRSAQTTVSNPFSQRFIPIIEQDQLLKLQKEGKRIIFVDAREGEEFDEEHIPGAINITLRDIPKYKAEILESEDIVISYCLKDFRGYEVAKALKENGLENVYTMNRPGLNGWKSKKLPTVGQRVHSNKTGVTK